MTDVELLELAAKAAGINGRFDSEWQCIWNLRPAESPTRAAMHAPWNPLTDDGDAQRLAVKLRIGTEWWESMPEGVAGRINFARNGVILMNNVHDMAAMWRRAVTRAAAEMARA